MVGNKIVRMAGIIALAATTVLATGASVMSVQVRKADIRGTPSFLGAVICAVAYGDKVTVEQQSGAWMKVSVAGQSGWLHSSALSSKNIVVKSGGATQSAASSGEVALAGKGFNSAVETEFKAGHKDIDFAPVDRMEKIKIPPSALQQFAHSGDLKMSAGGTQ